MIVEREALINHLTLNVTKQDIYDQWIKPMIVYYREVFAGNIKSNRSKEEIFSIISIKGTHTRNQMISYAAENYYDDDFYRFMVDQLDPKLLHELVWNRKVFDRSDLSPKEKLYTLNVYTTRELFNNQATFVTIDPIIGSRYKDLIPKPEYYKWQDSKVDESLHQIFTNETSIFSIMPRLIELAKKELIKRSSTGSINLTYARKIQEELEIPEFFAGHPNNKYKFINTKWLLQLATYAVDHKLDEMPIIDLIKKVVNRISYDTYLVWDCIKDQYTGTSKIISDPLPTQENLILTIEDFAKQEAWVSEANYLDWVNYHDLQVKPFELPYNSSLKLPSEGSFSTTFSIDKRYFGATVMQPFQNGFIFYLAALGLVEIIAEDDTSIEIQEYNLGRVIHNPFFGLTSIKITELGRHVFGYQEDYDAPVVEILQTDIEFDEQHLTISLSQKDMIISSALKEYANVINERLFTVDKASFLQKVTSKDDLREKLTKFHTLLKTPDFPDLWVRFFNELQGIFNPLIIERENYVSLIIPSGSEDIVKLLRFEEKMKGLFIKAEGRRVLVPSNKYNTFKRILRDNGWVLED